MWLSLSFLLAIEAAVIPAFPLNLSVHLSDKAEMKWAVSQWLYVYYTSPVWSPWVTLSQNTTQWNRTTVFYNVGSFFKKPKTESSCGAEPVRRFPERPSTLTPLMHTLALSTPPCTLSFVIIHLTSRGHLPINCNYEFFMLQHTSSIGQFTVPPHV